MTVAMAFSLSIAAFLAVTLWEWRALVGEIDEVLGADPIELCATCRTDRRRWSACLEDYAALMGSAGPVVATVLGASCWPAYRGRQFWQWITRSAEPEHSGRCILDDRADQSTAAR
ncbi:hypothetical protein ACQP10_37970 (plasmid) [Streptosporangium sandarakinum]|uniref:hypothetical protein n=1 Tax=Streptosporangium sandarakinum TaxID=1260955 RepID=UPI003D916981